MTETWVRLGDADAVPPGKRWVFDVDDLSIAVFDVDGTLYAIDDSCPHQGSSLGMGKLDGFVVTCPGHGLRFNVATGRKVGAETGVRAYPVKRTPDGIFVSTADPPCPPGKVGCAGCHGRR